MTVPKFAKNTRLGRVYEVPGFDQPMPSVTNVIRKMAAPGLEKWKQEQVALAAYRGHDWRDTDEETGVEMILAAGRSYSRKAALRGTKIHELIESGVDLADPEFLPFLVGAAAVWGTLGERYASEITLVSTKYGYAGTADEVTHRLERPSELSVTDWKTTKEDKSVGWREHQLQLAALSQCDAHLTDDGELLELDHQITELRVVGLRPDSTYEIRQLDDPNRIAKLHAAFLGLLDVWELERDYPWLEIWEDSSP